MKIAVASDLHLEFGDLDITNDSQADVLILSGDICVAADLDMRDRRQTESGFARYRSERFHEFFERCAANFPHVIYIMGNHEYYHSDFATELSEVRRKLEHLPNLYILEREIKVINDVTFIGGTLWTDMNNSDALTLYHMRTMMNDFRVIQNSTTHVNYRADVLKDKPVGMTDDEFLMLPTSERFKTVFKTRTAKFQPEDAAAEHAQTKGYIQQIIEGKPDQKFVVVGHHAPSRKSTHEMYVKDTVMNGGYSSNMDEFIMDHPQIRLWTHGHTHHVFDYVIGETRVVCNPRGYINYEARASEWKLLTVDI
jgi:Icc-related predicted phosphoesterase